MRSSEGLFSGIREELQLLYGPDVAAECLTRIQSIIDNYRPKIPSRGVAESGGGPDQRDVILITYGDMLRGADTPLRVLGKFLRTRLRGAVNSVHILPFFPYSSDDGFSVMDFRKVNPEFGTWDDVRSLGEEFSLMFDAVVNHVSRAHEWFQRYLAWETPYRDYFITVDPSTDLSTVTRPRDLPLLTAVETADGLKHVWTTFSEDQIDLNCGSPDVLMEILDLLLFYVSQGARFIRLDAIAYLWKEMGTSCIHLPQTHAVVRLMRKVLDAVAPHVLIVTETNVPHRENVSYFGDGTDEAQMVYQFSLPPLLLHALLTGDASYLTRWAADLETPSDRTTFFNFTASHDGIGVRPAEGILPEGEIERLLKAALDRGGQVSYKSNPDGSKTPYELNVTYLDVLSDSGTSKLNAERFLCSQTIALAMRGVPGIYFHSLVGSRNFTEGVRRTGRARTINREKLDKARLESEIDDLATERHHIFSAYLDRIRKRIAQPAFHPNAGQRILELHRSVFAFERASLDGSQTIVVLNNVSGRSVGIDLKQGRKHRLDILSGSEFRGRVTLAPYQCAWLTSGIR